MVAPKFYKMEVTNSFSDNTHIVVVKGLARKESLSNIKQVLADGAAPSEKHLWIDCSNLHRFSTADASLCSFVSELLKLRNQGTRITLCNMDIPTQRLFSLLKLDTLFFKADSTDCALAVKKASAAA